MVVAAGLTDVNFALSFWTALTFLIRLVVLGKFAWGPILQMLETRERAIAEAIESAKRERAAAEAASAEMKATLEKARAEAAELIRRNQQEVAAAKAELMAQAKKESEDLLQAARKTITEEKRQALAELRSQKVELELLGHRLAHVDLPVPLQVGQALEIEDPVDQLVGVFHLLDALLAHLLGEAIVAPVVAEAGVEEVLVDGGQLGREHVVEQRNDLLVAFHEPPPIRERRKLAQGHGEGNRRSCRCRRGRCAAR